ncbi:MAG: thymidine phosphorylase [Candidatus Marinimicrobia bacterium]|nr:thymidine phosphorylase [Candidatus Neomarinimicrobiota bacterium]
MIAYELIHKQQQGIPLSGAEIAWLVDGFANGSVPDEQLAAWLMAVYFKGMTGSERQALVAAMVASGRRLDFSALDGYVADKHSTGGVGDKVSLILAPLVAACGVYVPMISGRGLGHTGGTLDKLESIPGFGTNLELDAFQRQVGEVGVAIMSQTDEIVPADRKMYALRDVTATVESLPLICGSIMSKKIAEGIQGLVLDVKWGSGAFMATLDEARALAEALQQTGADFGVETVARITDMNQPLGRTAGLWCEVREALAVLEGGGPPDLVRLTTVLAADILTLAGRSTAEAAVSTALSSGRAREKFDQLVAAQGGAVAALSDPATHRPAHTAPLSASRSGILHAVDTYRCGLALITAGAGRQRQGDSLDPSAGFVLELKIGDRVHAGDELGRVFGADRSKVEAAAARLLSALTIGDGAVEGPQLVVQ